MRNETEQMEGNRNHQPKPITLFQHRLFDVTSFLVDHAPDFAKGMIYSMVIGTGPKQPENIDFEQ